MNSQEETQRQAQLEHQRQLLHEARRRLRVLEVQRVQEGYQARPQIVTEIETLETEIKRYESNITELQKILHRSWNVNAENHPHDEEYLLDKPEPRPIEEKLPVLPPQVDAKNLVFPWFKLPTILIGAAALATAITGLIVVFRLPASLTLSPTSVLQLPTAAIASRDEQAAQATVEAFSANGQTRRELESQWVLYDKSYGWKQFPTQVSAKDFSISARMYVPNTHNDVWSYGFAFGKGCKFFIGGNGQWTLQCANKIAGGIHNELNTENETYNDLSLTVLKSTVLIFINNKHIATENLLVDVETANEIFIGWQLGESKKPLSTSVSVYFEKLRVIVKNS